MSLIKNVKQDFGILCGGCFGLIAAFLHMGWVVAGFSRQGVCG
jgi:hypothetical protein